MLLDVRCAAALRTRTRGGTPLAGAPLQHRLTHCKDERSSATKASKRLCCYFAAICSAQLALDRLTHWKDECSPAIRRRQKMFAVICSALLMPHLSRDRLTHCKDECFRLRNSQLGFPKNDYQHSRPCHGTELPTGSCIPRTAWLSQQKSGLRSRTATKVGR